MEKCQRLIPKDKIHRFKFLLRNLKSYPQLDLNLILLALINPGTLLNGVEELNIPDEIVNLFTFGLLRGNIDVRGFWCLTDLNASFTLTSTGYDLVFKVRDSLGETSEETELFTQGQMVLYQKLPSNPFPLGVYGSLRVLATRCQCLFTIRNVPKQYIESGIGKYVYPSSDNGQTYRLLQVAELVAFK